MTAIQVRSEALPSLEKARMLLERCRSTQECQKIRALAQAVASCAATEQARDEAAAIVLLAKARIGELTADGEGANRRRVAPISSRGERPQVRRPCGRGPLPQGRGRVREDRRSEAVRGS